MSFFKVIEQINSLAELPTILDSFVCWPSQYHMCLAMGAK